MSTRLQFSVVVTNYNYGHFLSECIESVLGQTVPAAELIVVDDGSTDSSGAVLDGYERNGSLKVIRLSNSGQTGAINAGFAATTGQVVLFLDADDRLYPHALEILALAWSQDLAMLSFPLSLIDSFGKTVGAYREATIDGDNLPPLIARGTIAHYPTSGNAFRRSAIAPAFPIPAADWPISTDALLIRLATLSGKTRVLSQELGAYRVHGANNYFISGLSDRLVEERALRHMALASRYLAFDAPRATHPDPASVRLAFAIQAVKLTLWRALVAHNFDGSARAVRAILRGLSELRGVPPVRWRVLTVLAPLGISDRVNRRLAERVRFRESRSAFLDGFVHAVLGQRLRGLMRSAQRPREAEPVTGRLEAERDQVRLYRLLPAVDWHFSAYESGFVTRGRDAAITIALPASHEPLLVRLELRALAWAEEEGLRAILLQDGVAMASRAFSGRTDIEMTVPSSMLLEPRSLDLELRVEPLFGSFARSLKRLGQQPGIVTLDALEVLPAAKPKPAKTLSMNAMVPFDAIGPSISAEAEADDTGSGGCVLSSSPATLSVVPPDMARPPDLAIRFRQDQPPAWLNIFQEGDLVFDGTALPGGTIRFALLPADRARETPLAIDLLVNFQEIDTPAAPKQTLAIDSLGLAGAAYGGRMFVGWSDEEGAWPLPLGARLTGKDKPRFERHFIEGWRRAEDGTVTLAGLMGAIVLRRALGETGHARVHLSVDIPPDRVAAGRPLLAIEIGDERVFEDFVGEHVELSLAIPETVHEREIRIELFAGLIIAGPEAEPFPSGLIFNWLELQPVRIEEGQRAELASAGMRPKENAPLGSVELAGTHVRQTSSSGSLLAILGAVGQDELSDPAHGSAAGDYQAELAGLSAGAIRALAGDARIIRRLLALASASSERAAAGGRRFSYPPDDPVELRLRTLFSAILSGPAWRCFEPSALAGIPEILILEPDPFAAYLTAPGGILRAPADQRAFMDYLLALVDAVRARLLACPPDSAGFRFVGSVLRHMAGRPLLFGDANLRPFVAAYGRAEATLLLMSGVDVFAPPPALRRLDDDGRLSIGVILRSLVDSPEAALLFGMFGGLNPERFAITVYTDASGPRLEEADHSFDRVVDISGMPIDHLPVAIQNDRHHIVALGSFTCGYSDINHVFAHRLAPVQLITSGVSPASSGLPSVAHALSSRLCEPPDAAEHYTERLTLWDEPAQCFAFSPETESILTDPGTNRAILRRRLGVPLDRTLAVSGAMAEKIGEPLLSSWIEILSRTPGAVLVLYPFAPNWVGTRWSDEFRADVSRHLARAGLGEDRILILDTISHADVIRLLLAADLYLDSFPYAGATTVVEALRASLPVVALRGTTQRGLQGAGWLDAHGLSSYAAETAEAYVETACMLLSSAGRRDNGRREVADAVASHEALHNPRVFGERFGRWLETVAEEAGVPARQRRPAPRERQPLYLFHHLPKTGGTSVTQALKSGFEIVYDYREPWSDVAPERKDLDMLTPRQLLCGHYDAPEEMRLWRRYPDILASPNWRVFTFVRDPLERAISDYFYQKHHRRQDPAFRAENLSDYLREDEGGLADHFGCAETDWREALERYWFIGTQERLDECLIHLAKVMGVQLPDVLPRANVSLRDEVPCDEAITVFARNHALDYEIYRFVSSKLDRLLSKARR